VGTNVCNGITVAMLQAVFQNTTDSTIYWGNKNEITQNNGKTKKSYIMRNNSIHCGGRNH
jgi:hypothetical protein